jgi:glycosyltransferase 2 family protein
MHNYLKAALTILLLIFLVFFIRATDWQGVLASVRQVGFNFLFLLLISFLSAWLSVVAWRYCLPNQTSTVSKWKLFWIRQIGENVAILNPTSVIGGEATKIYMLRQLGVDKRQALNSILLSRALTIISQVLMLLMAGGWFLSLQINDFPNWREHWLWLILIPAMLAGIFYVLRHRLFKDLAKAILLRLGLLNRYLKAREFITEIGLELHTFYWQNRRALLLSFLASCLHWIVGSLEFYYILLFLGIKTTVIKALLVDMGVIVFKSAGAFVPGQIGVEEYGNKVMLGMIGISGGTIWITVSVLRRARQLSWILMSLLIYFVFFNRRLAQFEH